MTPETPYNARGARLWASLMAQDATLNGSCNPLSEVAESACRAADRLDMLEELASTTPPITTNGQGVPAIHPVHVEVRLEAASLAKLIAALRLPDPKSGQRPQRRQARGFYAPARVSSLERARTAAQDQGRT